MTKNSSCVFWEIPNFICLSHLRSFYLYSQSFSSDDASEFQQGNTGIERFLGRRIERASDFETEGGKQQRVSYKSEVVQWNTSDFRSAQWNTSYSGAAQWNTSYSGAAQWNTSEFSPCSQTCAGGIQTRVVFCEKVIFFLIISPKQVLFDYFTQ